MIKIGIECEGVYAGMPTLFIAQATNEEIYHAIKGKSFCHIYLGADYYRPTFEQVNYVIDLVNGRFPITFELDLKLADEIPLNMIGKVRFLFRIRLENHHLNNFDAFKPVDQIKLETKDKCYIIPIGCMLDNDKNYLDTQI